MTNERTNEHDDRCARCAEAVWNLLDGQTSKPVILAALRLAYSTGARDQQLERLAALAARDDERAAVSG